jgi:uncharacterized protein (DUF302 family)
VRDAQAVACFRRAAVESGAERNPTPTHGDNDDQKGIVTIASPYPSVSETLERLRKVVRESGLEEFALIDHGGAAERAGLKMQEAKLLVFGSPRAGTPLMVASPLLALDLPLKVLVWRDRAGATALARPRRRDAG